MCILFILLMSETHKSVQVPKKNNDIYANTITALNADHDFKQALRQPMWADVLRKMTNHEHGNSEQIHMK